MYTQFSRLANRNRNNGTDRITHPLCTEFLNISNTSVHFFKAQDFELFDYHLLHINYIAVLEFKIPQRLQNILSSNRCVEIFHNEKLHSLTYELIPALCS